MANAQVCKTCTHGFNSRPALQFLPEVEPMPNNETRSSRRVSLDTYAVALAIALAVLVRFNWIPPIKW